ncbi:DUF6463 family protein [Nocardia transvalensis]|uniref:DUF6463 family protein n=1 Tax=Nocardia transvalensis TaxID=37333 RepID=UPI001895F4B7|nr:DUF6463 family protein [Nocardia transvalensis]MBF6331528.1 hypothetical protein [Nocardia transvalensis]
MIKWAGWIIALFGAAHTILALTLEHAGRYAGDWFSGELWGEDLSAMSPANSAYWLSLNSFGPSMVLIGLLVLWMDRRGITPPAFLGWTLLVWTVIGFIIEGPTPSPIFAVATILLLVAARRAARRGDAVPRAAQSA